MLAMTRALELWGCYLDSLEFIALTDHSPVTFFHHKDQPSPRQTMCGGRPSCFEFSCNTGQVEGLSLPRRPPIFYANNISRAVTADLALRSLTAADAPANRSSLSAMPEANTASDAV